MRAAPAAPRAQVPEHFRQGQPEERRSFRDENAHPEAPHVHADNDRWIGHDTGRNDGHYRLNRSWEHGRFLAEVGPRHIYRLEGGGPDRFWFAGYEFSIAPYDVPYAVNWIWNSDNIVLFVIDPSSGKLTRVADRDVCHSPRFARFAEIQ